MTIYTKTGDDGTTSLEKGVRIRKDSVAVEALGTLDECNASIGAAAAHLPGSFAMLKHQLTAIQSSLFEVGASIVGTHPLKGSHLRRLEEWIDAMENVLPPLDHFILPGGHPAGAMLHLARTICRRAERAVVALTTTPEGVLPYLNRLSDYLFVAARTVNVKLGYSE